MNRRSLSVRLYGTILVILLLPAPLFSLQAPLQSEEADSAAAVNPVFGLLAEANDLAQNQFENKKALALYSEALLYESTNAEILWRISRSYVDIAEHLVPLNEEEEERQLGMYEKALEYADRSVMIDPANSMGLTRRAIARSRVALFTGLWGSIGMMKDIRADLEAAIALDSTNHLAYHTFGATHMKVTEKPWILRWPLGLGWADRSEAIALFQKAVDLRGDFIAYRLSCARAHAEEGNVENARAHLTLIPLLPTLDEDDPQYRLEAKDLLERLTAEE